MRAFSLVAGVFLLNSCATLNLLSHDVRAMDRDTKLFGSVTGSKARVEKVLVLKKSSTGEGFTVADSVKPNGMGDFAFLLPREKSYYLAAVAKGDSRKTSGKHELIGISGNKMMQEIPWREDSAKQEIVLKLSPSLGRKAPAACDVAKAVDAWKPGSGAGGSVPIACGDVVSL
ncbi:MAG: hypothetical protein EOP85_19830, partial [Verrucomicrobiaceae bacterium]